MKTAQRKSFYRYLITIAIVLSATNAVANTYFVTSTASSGTGSLRQAIADANANAGADSIRFAINATGVQTILLTTALPSITEKVVIDGYSQPGSVKGPIGSRKILIAINGNNTSGVAAIFYFLPGAAGSIACGLSIYNTGTSTAVFYISAGSNNIHIWGNYIGTDASGTANATSVIRHSGIYLGDVSSNLSPQMISNIAIGVNGDGINDMNEGNVISNANTSASGGHGIKLGYYQAILPLTNVRISGNYIGMAADGITPAPNGTILSTDINSNGFNGIFFTMINGDKLIIGSDGDGISDIEESNLISGNAGNGMEIRSSNGISIAGNLIGTDKTGTIPCPNGKKAVSTYYSGIAISVESLGSLPKRTCHTITIGFDDSRHGEAVAANVRNIISGNYADAIDVYNVANPTSLGPHNNIKIAGNFIGVDKSGKLRLSNGQGTTPVNTFPGHGVEVDNTSNLIVGTNGNGNKDDLESNIISGNKGGCGVALGRKNPVSTSKISGNYIGVLADTITSMANDGPGIWIHFANTTVVGSNGDGVSDDIEGNIIANNGSVGFNNAPGTGAGDGVRITGANSGGIRISRNSFFNNKGTAIDLANNDISVNDGLITAGQPNQLLDYPVITECSVSGSTLKVSGYVGTCSSGIATTPGTVITANSKTIEFYKEKDDGDQSGNISTGCTGTMSHGEGETFLGSIILPAGEGSFDGVTFTSLYPIGINDRITALTIDNMTNNTSEFGVQIPLSILTNEEIKLEASVADNCHQVKLQWSIPKGIVMKRLIIERSFSPGYWQSIAEMERENHSTATTHEFRDNNMLTGKIAYRVRLEDINLRLHQSPVSTVNLSCKQAPYRFWPNPVSNELHIDFATETKKQVLIYNSYGRLCSHILLFKKNHVINTTNWPNGVLKILVIENGKAVQMATIIKQLH